MGHPKLLIKMEYQQVQLLVLLAKCGVDVEALETIDLGKGEVLYFKQEVVGSESKLY